MKRIFGITLSALLGLALCACSTSHNDAGFSFKPPNKWVLAKAADTERQEKKYFEPGNYPDKAYLYTGGAHGKFFMAVHIKKDEAADPPSTEGSVRILTIRNIDWVQYPDFYENTVVVRKYAASYKNRSYTLFLSADGANNNYDSVYNQEAAALKSINISTGFSTGYGFGTGFIDGFIWPFKGIGNIFNRDIHLYKAFNNGASYIAGFVLGILIFVVVVVVVVVVIVNI